VNIKPDMDEVFSNDLPWNDLSNKTILVTGANGFIASYIVKFLDYLNSEFSMNINIVCNIRSNINQSSRLFEIYKKKRAKFVICDVCDLTYKNLKDTDIIIHAASQASPKYYKIDPVGTIKPNIIGTYNLLNLLKKDQSKEFIFISSGEVYGVLNAKKIDESSFGFMDPTNIRSCYGESKRMGESICISYSKQYDLNTKIVRPFHTYGPSLSRNDGRVFADFIHSAVDQKDIELTSDGKAYRPFCYITDFISGLFYVLFKGKSCEAYNIGNPKAEIKIKDLAYLIKDIVGDINIKSKTQDQNYLKSSIMRQNISIKKISLLGWSPKVNLKDGFTRAITTDKINMGL
jgi:UDP-glucuronate decarboxylase